MTDSILKALQRGEVPVALVEEELKRTADMSEERGELKAWAPWHPKHGFQDEFMAATWVSTDLDEIVGRVKRLNEDDNTNNRNGWRAVRVTLAVNQEERGGE